GSNSTPKVVASICAAKSSVYSPVSSSVSPCAWCSDRYPYVRRSVGSASPIDAEIRRLRSLVSDRAMTQCVISPGFNNFSPRLRGMILQLGGRMDETLTRLQYATPALRSACSNDASFSRWTPTPLVRNMCVGTIVSSPLVDPIARDVRRVANFRHIGSLLYQECSRIAISPTFFHLDSRRWTDI